MGTVDMFLRNVGIYLRVYTASQPELRRRPHGSENFRAHK
jgi:hypothetical protein